MSRPHWVPESVFPFKTRYLMVEGCQIHFVDEGEGPVLLMLHGNPTWSFLYRDVIKALRGQFRCIALDYPGFGLSRPKAGYGFLPQEHARVVKAFMEKMQLNNVYLLVHDWGGPIGFWTAQQDPSLVNGFIIGNTFAWPVTGDPHFERFSHMMGGRTGGWLIRQFNFFVNVLLPMGIKKKNVSKLMMRAYRGPFRKKNDRYATHVFPREILHSESFLGKVQDGMETLAHLPALIVWGDKDIAFREKERQRFESMFPYHQTVMLHGAGHFIQEDGPHEIARSIVEWHAGLPTQIQTQPQSESRAV